MKPLYEKSDLAGMFLPTGDMLQVHRIISIDGDKIVAERDLSDDEWIFRIHFPGDPIFPGSLMAEGAGQIVAIWGWHAGLRGKPRFVKTSAEFKAPLYPKGPGSHLRRENKKKNHICIGTVDLMTSARLVAQISACIAVLP